MIAVADAVANAKIAEMSHRSFASLAPVRPSTAPHAGVAVVKIVITSTGKAAVDVVDDAA